MPERVPLLAAVILLGTVACSPSSNEFTSRTDGGSSAAVNVAIDSMMAAYITAVESGDTAAIAAILAEDVEVVFPTGPMRKGRADVMEAFSGMFTSTTITQLRRVDVQRTFSGDMAVETGAFSITLQPKGTSDAADITDRGYYLVVWERQSDGSWKMARAFNRSDSPPVSAATAPTSGGL